MIRCFSTRARPRPHQSDGCASIPRMVSQDHHSMRLHDLNTPCLVLDQRKLSRNITRMSKRAHDFGIDLRPHLKTCKSEHIARLATAGHSAAITVSTLKEAEYFAARGFSDITYAVCITPDKLDRVARLLEAGAQIHVITDSLAVAQKIAVHPGKHSVLIEIDCGEHRTGVLPESPLLLEIAQTICAAPRCTLRGVLTHGGHSYACQTPEAIRAVAEEERTAVVRAAARLASSGFRCEVISLGSTPTASLATSFEGVTEMRPGVYLLGDMFQAGLGSCRIEDVAATVLATVISHQKAHNRLVIDAGALALSKDRSTHATAFDVSYGRLAHLETGELMDELFVADVHQEHGEVSSATEISWRILPIGSRVRVLVNHICMTAAMYDRYYVVDGSDEVVAQWPRVNGW
jgi:D-serine deaminase-like pyridoxal phosphate-dependent protein